MKGQQTDGKLSGGTVTVTADKIMLGTLAYLVAGDTFRDLLGPLKELGMKNPTLQVSPFPMFSFDLAISGCNHHQTFQYDGNQCFRTTTVGRR